MSMREKYKPISLIEALEWRARSGAVPYMGGTDLMIENSLDKDYLFLGSLGDLQYIWRDDEFIHVGAGVTFAQLLESEICPPLLKRAVSQIASPAIRNRATLGGNICNASPAGDTLPVLLVYDSYLTLESLSGQRVLPLADFIVSRKQIDLKENELLTGISLKAKAYNHIYYHKIGSRKAMSISKVALAGAARIKDGVLEDLALGLASMYKTPLRFPDLEAQALGRPMSQLAQIKVELVEGYAQRLNPIDDMRSTASYRKKVSLRLIRDFLDSLGR